MPKIAMDTPELSFLTDFNKFSKELTPEELNDLFKELEKRKHGGKKSIEERLDIIEMAVLEIKEDLQDLKGKVKKMTPPKIKGIKNLIITKEALDEIWDEGDDTL